MSLNKSDLDKVLRLSHLEIPDNEKEEYLSQLQKVLGHMERINTLDLSNERSDAWNEGPSTPEREDTVIKERHIDSMNELAPNWENDAFVVPQIIGDAS